MHAFFFFAVETLCLDWSFKALRKLTHRTKENVKGIVSKTVQRYNFFLKKTKKVFWNLNLYLNLQKAHSKMNKLRQGFQFCISLIELNL